MIINKMFIEGDNLMEQIKIEVEKCPVSVQSEMNGRLFAIRNEWNAFKKTARRPALLPGALGRDGLSSSSGRQMTRSAVLNQGIDSLQNTSMGLHRAEIVARESEEIGTNVLDELNSQRETLINSRTRLDETNANLKRSHRLIRIINSQVITNKCLLILIILVEIMILISVIYLRFIRKH